MYIDRFIPHKCKRIRWCCFLFKRYYCEGYVEQAAYLAYLNLISMVPMLTLIVVVISHLVWFNQSVSQLQAWLVSNLFIARTSSIEPVINGFINNAASLSLSYIIFFGLVSALVMMHISRVFRRIWKTDKAYSWLVRCLIYAAIVLVSPLFFLGIFSLSGLVTQILNLLIKADDFISLSLLVSLVSHVFLFLWLYVMNSLLPSCRVPARAAFIASLSGSLLLWGVRWLFGYTIEFTHTYDLLYGALSSIPIFLIWLYLSWNVILFSAVLGHSAVRFSQLPTSTKREL